MSVNINVNKNYFVYKVTNVTNNKVYIGITGRTIQERFQDHIKDSSHNGNNKVYFHRAIKKYGKNNFITEELFNNLTEEEALSKESELILFYNSHNPEFGYNIIIYGKISSFYTQEIRDKIYSTYLKNGKKNNSDYYGVNINDRFGKIRYRGFIAYQRVAYSKFFKEEKLAAEYYDKGVIYFKYNRPLNFPEKEAEYKKEDLSKLFIKRKKASQYKGVSKMRNFWQAHHTDKFSKKIHLGTFKDEKEAYEAYLRYIQSIS